MAESRSHVPSEAETRSRLERAVDASEHMAEEDDRTGNSKKFHRVAGFVRRLFPRFYYEVLGYVEREILIGGYEIGLRRALGEPTDSDIKPLADLLDHTISKYSSVKSKWGSPEAQMMDNVRLPDNGWGKAFH